MVRIFAPIFSVLALSSAVLAALVSEPAPVVASSSSSSLMHDATSTSSANAHVSTTTMAHEATSTSAAMDTKRQHLPPWVMRQPPLHRPLPPYHCCTLVRLWLCNWGTDLNSCVQMCQAKFGGGLSSASAPPPTTTTAAPVAGTGATHTVIVAPTKGVLRYVPFAVNASVGDTVRFMWGAGPHTVTKSSALTVCNKSADASTFASGQQNASFVFDQVVNNTEPTFFFCAVPNHCQKGMFGIINPPSAPLNPDLAKMQTAVDAMAINTPAYNWASNMDVSMFYAMNTGADQGASRPDGQPISIPNDVNTLLTGTAGNPGGANGAPAGATPSGTPSARPSTLLQAPA
ncbi:hypothetical protein RHS01_02502 [Rhizoctonia solani]|uniref:Phytocyanin domain-containing protein n=1 Tax=Rhizoctonia solani TaxID=456999 RepID=A0A8H7M7I5_9AGAM|nr:hypothetical protein RHS01_02502 [Rhizoctonia solani]